MKAFGRLFFFFILLSTTGFPAAAKSLPTGFPDTPRNKLRINTNWKFHLGNPAATYYESDFKDDSWETVHLPHTLQLTSLSLDNVQDDKTQPTFHREVGWYRRDILVASDSEKKVFLEFEGAHQVTDLWVNGTHVGQHAVGGYTPFHFDISDFVDHGKSNQITLLVDNRRRKDVPPDPGPFDYIKFSGLYRDVYLVETDSLRIPFNWESMTAGVNVTTPSVDPLNKNATINVKTGICNDGPTIRTCSVLNRVIDHKGFVVIRMQSEEIDLQPGQSHQFNQIGGIEENLQLWDVNKPYLYRLNTVLLEGENEVDFVETRIGIRTFELDRERGFLLNGREIELIGMNRHQHYGYIGDAMPNSLHYKDMLQFKELGFNVVRTAHYTQDDALIEACDELGILVYEEAPTWIAIPNEPAWYDNLEKAARTMVRNHRNHPSVVIWGAGINHRGYVAQIHYAVKQEDPFRMTASQNSQWTGWQTSGLTDIFANMDYGPTIWDGQEPLLAMEGGRTPRSVAKYKRNPKLTGLISWTAHAYYTFHEVWPWESDRDRTRSGLMTAFRIPKHNSYHWYPTELTDNPMVYILNDWTAENREVVVYSNCDHLEIFLNGKSKGTYWPSEDPVLNGLEHPPFYIKDLSFEPGELRVDGIINGQIAASQTIHTPGKAVAVQLNLDTDGRTWIADGSDIVVGHAYIIDKNGTVLKDFDGEVTYSVSGEGNVVGDKVDIGANPFHTEVGVAPLLIRSSNTAGQAIVTAKSAGLKSGEVTLDSIADEPDMVATLASPIYDLETVRVDMGEYDQLVQFDWIAWNGTDNEASETRIPLGENTSVSVYPASNDGILRWLGEMNVIGKFGFVYGEGILGIDDKGTILEFKNLPEGNYRLKTYHHAPKSNTNSMDPNREKLKTLDVLDLPYAKTILVGIHGRSQNVDVTEGEELQYEKPATILTDFASNGTNPVKVLLSDPNGNAGVWLNGFELSERP